MLRLFSSSISAPVGSARASVGGTRAGALCQRVSEAQASRKERQRKGVACARARECACAVGPKRRGPGAGVGLPLCDVGNTQH